MATPDASVIICTRNRSNIFLETCDALLAIDDGGLSWEIVIVDNASTDETPEAALSLSKRSPQPVKLAREMTLGLSTARNTGIQMATGRAIVFLDDDAIPWHNWLPLLVDGLDREGVYAAGGPVEPRFASDLPAWFSDRFLPYLTVWDLGPEVIELQYNEYPRGANMAFRREAFDRFGLFSTHLGRKAKSLLSCEETELCLRIERGGGSIVYVPGAGVDHLVEGGRVTQPWLRRRFRAQGTSEAIVEWQHAGFTGLAIGMWRSLSRTLHSRRLRQPDHQVVRQCELAATWGYLAGLIRAPLTVPRYRARPEAGPPIQWRPFR